MNKQTINFEEISSIYFNEAKVNYFFLDQNLISLEYQDNRFSVGQELYFKGIKIRIKKLNKDLNFEVVTPATGTVHKFDLTDNVENISPTPEQVTHNIKIGARLYVSGKEVTVVGVKEDVIFCEQLDKRIIELSPGSSLITLEPVGGNDEDGDNYVDRNDADPMNPFVFTGDKDNDGVDDTIDPDPDDPEVGLVMTGGADDPNRVTLAVDYNYSWAASKWSSSLSAVANKTCSLTRLYSNYYRHWSSLHIPVQGQGEKAVMVTTTSNTLTTISDCLTIMDAAYPTRTPSTSLEIFWRQKSEKALWYNGFWYEGGIITIPFLNEDGTVFAAPFEWMGYYPLFASKQEAQAFGSGGYYGYSFTWDAGINRPLGQIETTGRGDAIIAEGPETAQVNSHNESIIKTSTFYMPSGLSRATGGASPKDFRNYYWLPDDGGAQHPKFRIFHSTFTAPYRSAVLGLDADTRYDWCARSYQPGETVSPPDDYLFSKQPTGTGVLVESQL